MTWRVTCVTMNHHSAPQDFPQTWLDRASPCIHSWLWWGNQYERFVRKLHKESFRPAAVQRCGGLAGTVVRRFSDRMWRSSRRSNRRRLDRPLPKPDKPLLSPNAASWPATTPKVTRMASLFRLWPSRLGPLGRWSGRTDRRYRPIPVPAIEQPRRQAPPVATARHHPSEGERRPLRSSPPHPTNLRGQPRRTITFPLLSFP